MMNKKIKKEWVKRLRSGEYEQGESFLCSDDKFCCLGVLCDMAEEEGIVGGRVYGGIVGYSSFHDEAASCSRYMPPEVRDWAELGNTNPSFTGASGGSRYLAVLNDTGSSFNDIADIIEERL